MTYKPSAEDIRRDALQLVQLVKEAHCDNAIEQLSVLMVAYTIRLCEFLCHLDEDQQMREIDNYSTRLSDMAKGILKEALWRK